MDIRQADRGRLSGFLNRDDGSMTILALFFFITMVLVAGLSIDIMVFENNRTRLQNLGDRAALAAADLDQTLPPEDVVASYFEKEGMGDYVKSVNVSSNANARSVSIQTEKLQKTMFMNFMNYSGVDTLTPHSVSAATEVINDIEISLVLDVSNSMNEPSSAVGSASKLADLKSAAKRFIDKIYSGTAPERITVNLVPYSTHVNAGPVIMDALNVTKKHDFSHCLSFKDADFGGTDIRGGNAYDQAASFDQWYYDQQPRLYVCRSENELVVRPVMNDPAEIKNRIDAMTANGNTSIEIGLKWGAAFLDPSAQGLTSALIDSGQVDSAYRDRPYAWGRDNTQKYIVVLTDGINTEQDEINPAYETGPSGVWRWQPVPLLPMRFYSWYTPEVGDEDGDGKWGEKYWTPGFWIPKALTGLDKDIEIGRSFTNDPVGKTLSELNVVTGGTATARAANKAALIAALTPINIAPVQLDYSSLWNEMSVRHFAYYWVRARWNSNWRMNQFYSDVWTPVYGNVKDSRQLTLCDQLRTKGATIFTIGFEVTDHSANVMSRCASTPNYFIRVVGNDLEQAFDQIANSITKLRLTQ
ncbi:Tad domain-containing protein [Oceaniglobus roseus]|uniref:Tad domain-containing protein n=1 Tax=Oceaniglobus roseus TaxID=1737570 RepID=UPI00156293DD|nr:Tad domain-containing protein [Kandeliimicrobium roseum]